MIRTFLFLFWRHNHHGQLRHCINSWRSCCGWCCSWIAEHTQGMQRHLQRALHLFTTWPLDLFHCGFRARCNCPVLHLEVKCIRRWQVGSSWYRRTAQNNNNTQCLLNRKWKQFDLYFAERTITTQNNNITKTSLILQSFDAVGSMTTKHIKEPLIGNLTVKSHTTVIPKCPQAGPRNSGKRQHKETALLNRARQ